MRIYVSMHVYMYVYIYTYIQIDIISLYIEIRVTGTTHLEFHMTHCNAYIFAYPKSLIRLCIEIRGTRMTYRESPMTHLECHMTNLECRMTLMQVYVYIYICLYTSRCEFTYNVCIYISKWISHDCMWRYEWLHMTHLECPVTHLNASLYICIHMHIYTSRCKFTYVFI